QHALQHQLAPVALGLLALERLGQAGRLVTQALVELLQTLQLLAQGKALARLLLITFVNTFLERLDALLQRVEQLTEALLAGFGEALLTLVEDLRRQLGELRTQLVARALQVIEALLLVVAVSLQLGRQGRALWVRRRSSASLRSRCWFQDCAASRAICRSCCSSSFSRLRPASSVCWSTLISLISASSERQASSCASRPAWLRWACSRRSCSSACSPCSRVSLRCSDQSAANSGTSATAAPMARERGSIGIDAPCWTAEQYTQPAIHKGPARLLSAKGA